MAPDLEGCSLQAKEILFLRCKGSQNSIASFPLLPFAWPESVDPGRSSLASPTGSFSIGPSRHSFRANLLRLRVNAQSSSTALVPTPLSANSGSLCIFRRPCGGSSTASSLDLLDDVETSPPAECGNGESSITPSCRCSTQQVRPLDRGDSGSGSVVKTVSG